VSGIAGAHTHTHFDDERRRFKFIQLEEEHAGEKKKGMSFGWQKVYSVMSTIFDLDAIAENSYEFVMEFQGHA
jgi:hypothetical protein